MRNGWKTTAAGIVMAVAGFVAFSPSLFVRWPWVVDVAKYLMVGGGASIGLLARDNHAEVKADADRPK
jgi:hypothetical protein